MTARIDREGRTNPNRTDTRVVGGDAASLEILENVEGF